MADRGNTVDLAWELRILRATMFDLAAFTAFVGLAGALLGGVWWVCRNDSDPS